MVFSGPKFITSNQGNRKQIFTIKIKVLVSKFSDGM